jgi:hypothetical protein
MCAYATDTSACLTFFMVVNLRSNEYEELISKSEYSEYLTSLREY